MAVKTRGEKMDESEHRRLLNTCRHCGFKDEALTGIKNYHQFVIGGICNKCTKKRDIVYDFNEAKENGRISRDNEIMCPYCGYVDSDSWEHNDSSTYNCPECGEESELNVEYTANYTTTKKEIDKKEEKNG